MLETVVIGTKVSIMSLVGIFNALTGLMAYQTECDYFQNMAYDQTYYVYNNEYPGSYGRGASCRWVAVSPPDTRIVLSCDDINLPATSGCSGDRLSISLSGSMNFVDAHNYCGQGTLTLLSNENRISLGLFSTWNSRGGRFSCRITPIRTGQPTTTTTTPSPPQDCDCGRRQLTRIVGGTEVGVNEYPSMAALIDVGIRELYCGATIIASRYALTAAHCVTNRDPLQTGLLVGDHDISTGTDTNAAALYALERFIIHPNYNASTFQNDVAIVRTQSTIQFRPEVGPVCLPFRYASSDFTGESVTILGWGTLEFSGPKSDKLLGANLSVVSTGECRTRNPGSAIFDTNLCTYSNGKDSCQSDSGGPCLWMDPSSRRLQLIGVISFGLGCATSRPGVSARVTSYLPWIITQTSDTQYCIK